jgi:hypothetical protein
MGTTRELTQTEKISLEELIDAAVVARYDSELEREEDPREKTGPYYRPIDEDRLQEIFTELFNKLLSQKSITESFERLTETGAEKWPLGWCQEDIDEEENERIIQEDLDREYMETINITKG